MAPYQGAGLLARPIRNSGHPDVQAVAARAGEIHAIRDEYERFDAKDNMIWQPRWNWRYGRLPLEMAGSRKRRIKTGEPGYLALDVALMDGAAALTSQLDFGINQPWLSGNAWRRPDRSRDRMELPKPTEEAAPEPLEESQATVAVKRAAGAYGADLVGVAPLDRRWVYSHYWDPSAAAHRPIRFSDEPGLEATREPARLDDGTLVIPADVNRAVVLAVEMELEAIRSAPALRHMAATTVGYAKSQIVALAVAEFIRSLGYVAIPSSNCTALSIPLAIDAGLGELGRNAKLITPRFGPRVRLAKVLTNMPLAPDSCIQFGVLDFCGRCSRCAHECPAGAIPKGPRSYRPKGSFNQKHVLQYQLDHAKCYRYWAETGTNCGICLAVCPYNKGVGWVKGVAASLDCGDKHKDLDEVFGYGRTVDLTRYWE